MSTQIVHCRRCSARCRVGAPPNPDARMLRRATASTAAKGFCANCAATEWLLNAYPTNMIIDQAEQGPKILLFPHIQEQFASIMQAGNADARPAELDWDKIVANWDLTWPKGAGGRRSATNPYDPERDNNPEVKARRRKTIEELFAEDQEQERRDKIWSKGYVTTDDLNQLEPGLGDELSKCLDKSSAEPQAPPPPPPKPDDGEQPDLL